MPFLSKSAQKNPAEVAQFSEEPTIKTWLVDGFDLLHDKWYSQWLSEHHPELERQPLLARELFSPILDSSSVHCTNWCVSFTQT